VYKNPSIWLSECHLLKALEKAKGERSEKEEVIKKVGIHGNQLKYTHQMLNMK